MKTSIKINDQYIKKILLGSTPVQRIYQSGSIVYEAGGSTPTPCFEVVETISQASGDYIDVYAWDTEKWYKKNNLNKFEEYGLMPSVTDLSSTTYYTGKLVILSTDNHEYKWNGSEWIDLGATTHVGDQYEYVQGNGESYIVTDYIPVTDSRYEIDIEGRKAPSPTSQIGECHFLGGYDTIDTNTTNRMKILYPGMGEFGPGGIRFDYADKTIQSRDSRIITRGVIKLDKTGGYFNDSNIVTFSDPAPITDSHCHCGIFATRNYISSTGIEQNQNGSKIYDGKIYDFKIYENDVLVRHFIPAIIDNVVGMYEKVNGTMFGSYVTTQFTVGGNTTIIGGAPVEYDEKVAPANNVHYNTLEELELMECPWIGMMATVGQDNKSYVYTEYGWVPTDVHLNLPYLRFTAIETTEITFSQDGLEYSIDGGEWKTMSANTAVSVPASSYIIFKGKCTPTSSNGIGNFKSTGGFNVSGNVMSLLFGDDFNKKVSLVGYDNAFIRLFSDNNKLYDATNLVMPATTLSEYCYLGLFRTCSSLKAVNPNLLPATTLAPHCYQEMFYGCLSLKESPLLPATTLASYCYYTMFQSCALSTLPELPATKMASHCYDTMFNYVDADIPDNYLPSTQLAPYCYYRMFAYCSNRTKTMDILPATKLSRSCYDGMFFNNEKITEAPILPAETLTRKCYNEMFWGCSSLSKVIAKFKSTPSSTYTHDWLSDITATFYKNPNATWDQTISRNNSTVPSKWTITDIPSVNYLKFTTVDDNGSKYTFSRPGLEYSIDGGEWTTLAAHTYTPNVPKNSNIRFRGYLTPNGSEGIGTFSSSGKFNAEGELMTLLYGEYYVGQTGKFADHMFKNMFYTTKIVNAYNLVIPYNSGSYKYSCYFMFSHCSELEVAPKELKGNTYVNDHSFYLMFANCPKLTKTPIIGYTFPAYDAMGGMFLNDTLLSEVYILQTENGNHIDNLRSRVWLKGIASTGTFYANQNLTWLDTIERSEHTIPEGWTIVKVDPNDY